VQGVNDFSVGIELVNPGYLSDTGMRAKHKSGGPERTWALYPEAQVSSCADVCRALMMTYPIGDIVGHDDVSPGRKLDPGPAWDWTGFKARLLTSQSPQH
jgi:N-acetylmuramoyl-L-alanine amidase